MRAYVNKKIWQVRGKIEESQNKIGERELDLKRDGRSYDKTAERWSLNLGELEAQLEYWQFVLRQMIGGS